jgi:hypothetical protein
MRITEVEAVSNNLVLLLRNLVAQANSKQQPSFLNWAALNNLMQNVGEEQFDYDSFKSQYDASPMIQKLVFKFDNRGVELKTYGTDPKKSQGGEKETSISKMAKNAAKRRIS